MEFDVFLYGRTKTYDYCDMYMPSWLTVDSEEYNDYRKIISHLFRIRDILNESESKILEMTADSFYFYKTQNISILCRCCHTVGKDEYGRTICSTEGFVCKNENEKDFWYHVPDMIIDLISGEKTFYDDYIDKYYDTSKPPQIVLSKNIDNAIKFVSEANYSDNTELCIRRANIQNQFKSLICGMRKRIMPFNFVIGKHEKRIYEYQHPKTVPDIEMFFANDECTELSDNLSWNHKYKSLSLENKVSNYHVYLDIKKSLQEKIRYRLVTGNKPDSENVVTDVPFVTYEVESDTAINISELINMYETMREYLLDLGWCKSPQNKYIFEKW